MQEPERNSGGFNLFVDDGPRDNVGGWSCWVLVDAKKIGHHVAA